MVNFNNVLFGFEVSVLIISDTVISFGRILYSKIFLQVVWSRSEHLTGDCTIKKENKEDDQWS